MVAAPLIQVATTDDLKAIAQLREAQGWRRSEPVVRAALASHITRIFTVRAASVSGAYEASTDEPVATAGALAAGPIGVIGNVAVQQFMQRRGLGRLLTTQAIDWLREQGAQSVWLDATPSGRPLYLQLGFTDIAPSWLAQTPLRDLDMQRLVAQAQGYNAALAAPDALASLAALDREAFGGDRLALLHTLLRQPECALYVAWASDESDRQPLGYAITRRIEAPDYGYRLGSMVAPGHAIAAALTLATLGAETRRAPTEVAHGVSVINVSGGAMPRARAWFDSIGVTTEDDDTVMRLLLQDDGASPAETGLASAQERAEGRPSVYSWVAPMLF
ncbi:MAG TPA: GNAT family N-acetyltransferase [Ktedonobacterales bacterium]